MGRTGRAKYRPEGVKKGEQSPENQDVTFNFTEVWDKIDSLNDIDELKEYVKELQRMYNESNHDVGIDTVLEHAKQRVKDMEPNTPVAEVPSDRGDLDQAEMPSEPIAQAEAEQRSGRPAEIKNTDDLRSVIKSDEALYRFNNPENETLLQELDEIELQMKVAGSKTVEERSLLWEKLHNLDLKLPPHSVFKILVNHFLEEFQQAKLAVEQTAPSIERVIEQKPAPARQEQRSVEAPKREELVQEIRQAILDLGLSSPEPTRYGLERFADKTLEDLIKEADSMRLSAEANPEKPYFKNWLDMTEAAIKVRSKYEPLPQTKQPEQVEPISEIKGEPEASPSIPETTNPLPTPQPVVESRPAVEDIPNPQPQPRQPETSPEQRATNSLEAQHRLVGEAVQAVSEGEALIARGEAAPDEIDSAGQAMLEEEIRASGVDLTDTKIQKQAAADWRRLKSSKTGAILSGLAIGFARGQVTRATLHAAFGLTGAIPLSIVTGGVIGAGTSYFKARKQVAVEREKYEKYNPRKVSYADLTKNVLEKKTTKLDAIQIILEERQNLEQEKNGLPTLVDDKMEMERQLAEINREIADNEQAKTDILDAEKLENLKGADKLFKLLELRKQAASIPNPSSLKELFMRLPVSVIQTYNPTHPKSMFKLVRIVQLEHSLEIEAGRRVDWKKVAKGAVIGAAFGLGGAIIGMGLRAALGEASSVLHNWSADHVVPEAQHPAASIPTHAPLNVAAPESSAAQISPAHVDTQVVVETDTSHLANQQSPVLKSLEVTGPQSHPATVDSLHSAQVGTISETTPPVETAAQTAAQAKAEAAASVVNQPPQSNPQQFGNGKIGFLTDNGETIPEHPVHYGPQQFGNGKFGYFTENGEPIPDSGAEHAAMPATNVQVPEANVDLVVEKGQGFARTLKDGLYNHLQELAKDDPSKLTEYGLKPEEFNGTSLHHYNAHLEQVMNQKVDTILQHSGVVNENWSQQLGVANAGEHIQVNYETGNISNLHDIQTYDYHPAVHVDTTVDNVPDITSLHPEVTDNNIGHIEQVFKPAEVQMGDFVPSPEMAQQADVITGSILGTLVSGGVGYIGYKASEIYKDRKQTKEYMAKEVQGKYVPTLKEMVKRYSKIKQEFIQKLPNEKKFAIAYTLLNPERIPKDRRPIPEKQFGEIRRLMKLQTSDGYRKAFKLLFEIWKIAGDQNKEAIELATRMISTTNARLGYLEFAQNVQKIKDKIAYEQTLTSVQNNEPERLAA